MAVTQQDYTIGFMGTSIKIQKGTECEVVHRGPSESNIILRYNGSSLNCHMPNAVIDLYQYHYWIENRKYGKATHEILKREGGENEAWKYFMAHLEEDLQNPEFVRLEPYVNTDGKRGMRLLFRDSSKSYLMERVK